MTLEVDTVVAVSLMMAVFSAVAAVGTSIVLGVGFERLRAGFEIVSKQTGFFSDAIHKLERKVEVVDKQADSFTHSISTLESKVVAVGEQAGSFSSSMQKLEQKVDIVDRQAGFFGDAIYKLEKKIETIDAQEQAITEKMERLADDAELLTTSIISAGRDEALHAHSEDLLLEMGSGPVHSLPPEQSLQFKIPQNLAFNVLPEDQQSIRYH
ncbi:MAG: hypothetical protein IT558_03285 [Alphaproteobacteria bacterium]|nr:hypothetical protein [Alphaproteobacteria bacterium]